MHAIHRLSAAGLALLAVGLLAPPACAEVTFAGKQITMIVGFPPGGGTDVVGRLLGNSLSKYLPGQPSFVIRNVPGAEGLTAMNYMAQQVKPDGLTVLMGSASQADPMFFRKANAQYDPAKFLYVGGVGRGGTVVVVTHDALGSLHDKAKPAVIMASPSGIPRNGMQISLWGIQYLGWNARWVVGYPGTNEIMLALGRGEVDMTATGNIFEIGDQLRQGKLKIIAQSGDIQNGKLVARPDFGDAPLLPELMRGKITDPVGEKAFAYWRSIISIDKFVALPPGTPPEMLAAYRNAYSKLLEDADFVAQGKRLSADFTPLPASDVERIIATLVATPVEAVAFMKTMMRQQGLTVD
jgi:tripartite-type tricarboxylate transporter receptor subunit TctC